MKNAAKLLLYVFLCILIISSCKNEQKSSAQERISAAIKNNPKLLKDNPKASKAIEEAINKNPIIIFESLKLSAEQEKKIENIIKKRDIVKIISDPNFEKSPEFRGFIKEVKTFLSAKQKRKLNVLVAKILSTEN